MMRQQLRLPLDQVGEVPLQHDCNPGMQLLTTGAQQRAVSSVLHQRVLK